MSECHFFLSLRSPPTRASPWWSLSAVLSTRGDASKELNQGKESKAKRVSNVFATLAWFVFLTLLLHPPQFCHQVKANSPSLQAYPLRLGTRQRSQNKVRSSSRTRFSSLFYSFSNSASSFVSLFPLSPSNPSSLLEPRPHPLYACRRVSRASAS